MEFVILNVNIIIFWMVNTDLEDANLSCLMHSCTNLPGFVQLCLLNACLNHSCCNRGDWGEFLRVSWLTNHCIHLSKIIVVALSKSLEPPLISFFFFLFKESDILVILKCFWASFPLLLKIFQSFSLNISCFFTHFWSGSCTWPYLSFYFCLFVC